MADPTRTTACWSLWLVIAVFTLVPVRAGDKVCSIGRHGTLTRFNEETVTVALPCKYRMADFTCAQYRVKVTPGNSVDDDGSFNLDTVWLKVVDVNRGEEGTFRTSIKRLAKYQNGDVRSPWKSTGGSLSGADDAVSYNRSARAVTFSPVDQLSVLMQTDPASLVLTCRADNFSSRASPETLCGDGTTSDTMERAALRVLGNDSDLTTQQFIHYTVMKDVTVTQSDTCRAPASQFQTCPYQENAARTCDIIFDDPSRVTCLLQSGTALQDYYTRCLQAVCDGDASATVAMETYLRDNCSGPSGNTGLYYRIVPDETVRNGLVMPLLLLDGGRMVYLYQDTSLLRLVSLQSPNTTLSSLDTGRCQGFVQLSNDTIVAAEFNAGNLKFVKISGDVLRVDRDVNTEKNYVGLYPGPNNTIWASVFRNGNTVAHIDQLDLQGRTLGTAFNTTGREVRRIKHYGDDLYLFTFRGQLGVLSLVTGEVTTTIGQTDLTTLGAMIAYDLVYDHKGDAYICVGGEVCGNERGCVLHLTPSGQVTVLRTFFSGVARKLVCVDLIVTANQLLINWVGHHWDSSGYYSEITVQSLPV